MQRRPSSVSYTHLDVYKRQVGYLEQVARSTITVPEADLTALGQARALAIERALLASTGLDPGRVFTLRESNASASAGKVRLALALK